MLRMSARQGDVEVDEDVSRGETLELMREGVGKGGRF
jgi:hypothetical protein